MLFPFKYYELDFLAMESYGRYMGRLISQFGLTNRVWAFVQNHYRTFLDFYGLMNVDGRVTKRSGCHSGLGGCVIIRDNVILSECEKS